MTKNDTEQNISDNEVKVRICNELKIQTEPWYSFYKDIKFWIPTLISLIAVFLSILPYCRDPEIGGNIAGIIRSGNMTHPFTDVDGTQKELEGVGYTLNVIIGVRNKNVSINDFDIYLKYSGDNQKYKGEIIPAHEAILDFNGTKKKLLIPVGEELLFTNVLEVEKVNSYFIRFIIDHSIEKTEEIKKIEEVEIIFYDFKDNTIKLSLKLGNPRRMLSFANKYWAEIN